MFTAGVTSLSLAFVLTLLGTGLWMSYYKDIKTWLQKQYSNKQIDEGEFSGKYSSIHQAKIPTAVAHVCSKTKK